MASPRSPRLPQHPQVSKVGMSTSNSTGRQPQPRAYVREGVAAVLLFVLLMEWLRPLAAMSAYTDIHMLKPFLLTFAFFMLIDYVKLPAVLGWFVKLIACMVVIGMLFYRKDWLGFSWTVDYLQITLQDIAVAAQSSMEDISPHNRTLMFLLGWALLLSVMYTTVVERQQALWLIAATILYLVGMQLWAGIDTSDGIFRAFIAGMLLMTVGQLSRVEGQFALRIRNGGWRLGRWPVAVAIIMAVAIGTGLWLSHDEARMTRPLDWNPLASAWARLFPDGSGAGATPRSTAALAAWTGYGDDDSRLGGPLSPDNRVAFTARTEQPTYWRGESRSTYTGRGWISGPPAAGGSFAAVDAPGSAEAGASTTASSPSTAPGADTVPLGASPAGSAAAATPPLDASSAAAVTPPLGASPAGSAATDITAAAGAANGTPLNLAALPSAASARPRITIQQEIMLDDPSLGKQLFAGGAIAKVQSLVTRQGTRLDADQILVDSATGRAAVQSSDPIAYYRLAVEVPADGKLSLAQAAASRPLAAAERAAMAGDLQLPAALPDRVRELAKTISAAADNDYSRALSIETYLRSHYAYSMDKATYPGEDQDFVDHFLFDDRVGYCNHFSTAMVVMLRTLDIPARWVKGFAPGQPNAADSSPTSTLISYTVLNRDAHSWVEAYFPGQGWVMFEPTPGFSNSDQAAGNPDYRQGGETIPVTVAASSTSLNSTSNPAGSGSHWWSFMSSMTARWLSALTAVLLLPPLWWLIRHWSRSAVNGQAPTGRSLKAYDAVWTRLYRRLGHKRPDQTVREYVSFAVTKLPDEVQREALLQFASLYESARYADTTIGRSTVRKAQLAELWNLISRSKST